MSDGLNELIRNFLLESFVPDGRPEDLPDDLDLIRSGVLNSLALVQTATFLEELAGTPIESHELNPRNISTIALMAAMVRQRREQA